MSDQHPITHIDEITRYFEHDLENGLMWWEEVLRQDEWERLNYLIGAALVNPEICARLLELDEDLLKAFRFSESTRHLLLEIRATTLSEFAEAASLKRHASA